MLARPNTIGLPPGHAQKLKANYAGMVALIDDQIGHLLAILEERGELDTTVIVFTADHGEMNGDHGLVYKSNFLDGAARIPLLISTPETRRSAGRVDPTPTELIDIGATLVEVAGATWDWQHFGTSFLPTTRDPSHHHRRDAICEFEGEVMILTDDWKAAINHDGQICLLIDRHRDPDEQHNLAGLPEHQTIRDQLRLRILERLSKSHRQIPIAGYICD